MSINISEGLFGYIEDALSDEVKGLAKALFEMDGFEDAHPEDRALYYDQAMIAIKWLDAYRVSQMVPQVDVTSIKARSVKIDDWLQTYNPMSDDSEK